MKWFCKRSFEQNFALLLRVSRTCTAFILSLLLTSCSLVGGDFSPPERLTEREPRVQQIPEQAETVRGDKDPPVVKLQLGRTLRPANLRPSEDLPAHIKIGATNLNNVPVTTALQAVLADTDITLLWESEELQTRKVTLMNLKGSLPVVVSRMCRAAKILCAYRNGALELAEEDTFVVELPGVAVSGSGSAANTIADSIEALIDGKVKADTNGGNLIYTTNAIGHERVQGYLDQLRNGRPLIVMQLYIWQVTLDDTKKLGISWKDLHLPDFGGKGMGLNILGESNTSTVGTSKGVSLGAVLSGAVDVNVLAGFLATQGKVQNISSPQLTFVSGTSAKFEVGDSERYVSQVGTLVNSTVAGTGTTSGASNNTVNTEELKTGLQITVTGNYEGGVVFSKLEIKTSDFIRFTNIPTGTTQLQLPKTANRAVQTVLRVRPGDNLVLAGLQTSREDRNREGLPGPDFMSGIIPTYGTGTVSNSELVVMVKPSVVFFSDKEAPDLRNVDSLRSVGEVADKPKEQPAVPEKVSEATDKKVAEDQPVKPNDLQNEFGQVVKMFEETHIPPVKTPETALTPQPISKDDPQSILPPGQESGGT
ncbi:MAG: hypothetical protein SFW65_06430 [Alphaproteobacteria bacterium]|nr:hypothetical protein [Alphaproteobacteria bacterium]